MTRSVAATMAASTILALALLSVSPAAHAWIHGESHDSGHEHEHAPRTPDDHDHVCAVTLAQQGFCDITPACALQPIAVRLAQVGGLSAQRVLFAEADHRLPSAQAPPERKHT